MMRGLLIALLLATPSAAANLPSPNWPAPADRGEGLLRSTVLNAHNAARRQFGVGPVGWSDQLAAEALAHARYMAATGIYGMVRYHKILMEAERIGEHATCEACGAYARFKLITASDGRCRKCNHQWRVIVPE